VEFRYVPPRERPGRLRDQTQISQFAVERDVRNAPLLDWEVTLMMEVEPAPVLVLLSTIAVLWWRSTHLVR
jgi:hypothetical protein